MKEVGELSEITTKTTNRTMKKRELTLVDDTGFSVRVTLWGNTAEKYEEEGHPVIAFKGVKVGDFGGLPLHAHVVHDVRQPGHHRGLPPPRLVR